MKLEDMNQTQRLVSDISGYCGLFECGAKNDAYYECKTEEDKYDFLQGVIDYSEGFCVFCNLESVFQFLETEFSNSNDKYNKFIELKDNE